MDPVLNTMYIDWWLFKRFDNVQHEGDLVLNLNWTNHKERCLGKTAALTEHEVDLKMDNYNASEKSISKMHTTNSL